MFLTLVSCKSQWNKATLEKKCNTDFSKRDDIKQYFNDAQMKELCSCVADQMLAKYKSEAEANKDTVGAKQIGEECAILVLRKKAE
jgi:hypothetical protein